MSSRKDRRLPGGGRLLVEWGLWEVERELADEMKSVFRPLLLRKLCHVAIFNVRWDTVRDAWQRNPDLVLKVFSIVLERVPLPSSRTKKMRVWSWLLSPSRVFADIDENRGAKRKSVRDRLKAEASDAEVAYALTKLGQPVRAEEVSNLRRKLLDELRMRKLI